jgi:hypothetical protein
MVLSLTGSVPLLGCCPWQRRLRLSGRDKVISDKLDVCNKVCSDSGGKRRAMALGAGTRHHWGLWAVPQDLPDLATIKVMRSAIVPDAESQRFYDTNPPTVAEKSTKPFQPLFVLWEGPSTSGLRPWFRNSFCHLRIRKGESGQP